MWTIELHSHTHYSKDSVVKFETIQHICHQRQIDKIVITDHNTAEGALAFQKIAPQLVIVGEEIMTTKGELLGYFMQETIPAGLTPRDTIRALRAQGAIISVSHPFDELRKGAWFEHDLLEIIHEVDAIETFNARCVVDRYNDRAKAFAKQHGLLGTVGSDAHLPQEYGMTVARVQPFQTPQEFLQALQAATTQEHLSPSYVHVGSSLAKWSRKLNLIPQPRH